MSDPRTVYPRVVGDLLVDFSTTFTGYLYNIHRTNPHRRGTEVQFISDKDGVIDDCVLYASYHIAIAHIMEGFVDSFP